MDTDTDVFDLYVNRDYVRSFRTARGARIAYNRTVAAGAETAEWKRATGGAMVPARDWPQLTSGAHVPRVFRTARCVLCGLALPHGNTSANDHYAKHAAQRHP